MLDQIPINELDLVTRRLDPPVRAKWGSNGGTGESGAPDLPGGVPATCGYRENTHQKREEGLNCLVVRDACRDFLRTRADLSDEEIDNLPMIDTEIDADELNMEDAA